MSKSCFIKLTMGLYLVLFYVEKCHFVGDVGEMSSAD